MKNTAKRIITFVMATVLIASLAMSTVSAAEAAKPKTLLALGDSITTGYGLANYTPDDTPYLCNSYINMIAKAMGLEGDKDYINRAINGDTSSDLATLIPLLETEVKSAEMIIITIGGNDLLQAIPMIASVISGKQVTDLMQAAEILMDTTPEKFAALSQNTEFQTKIAGVLTNFVTNITTIATYIKQNAPTARVIFLKQYNPMKNVLGLGDFGNFAQNFITPINNTIDNTCKSFGFESVDVPSVIDVNAAGLTNILNYDIHPNAAGHIEIAKLLATYLGLTLELPEETTAAPEETTTAPEETTKAPEETTDTPEDATNAPDQTTDAPEETTNAPEVDTGNGEGDATPDSEPAVKNGCFSSVSAGAVILVSLCALAVIKKKN